MYKIVGLIFVIALYLAAGMTATPQSDNAPATQEPTGVCKDLLARFGPELDQLLADTNPEAQLSVRYQSALRLNLLASACKDAPQTNPYGAKTAPAMATLQTEIATDTVNKCKAMGTDIFNQLKQSGQLITQSPERLKVTTGALREMVSLLKGDCPEDLASSFDTLVADMDRFDRLADQWPACKTSRETLKASMRDLTEKLNDPTNDPLLAEKDTYQPALANFRQECGMETSWMADQETSITKIGTMIEERTPLTRKACISALSEAEGRLDTIHARSAAFKPGCDLFLALTVANEDDKRNLDVTFNSTCRLFPSATKRSKERYERELRLVEELDAEDRVMRYRLEQGETDAVTCSK